ncbi:Periplasmic serine proteases (ClpP class) [Olavius algarvensis associated proteobacterium Delta 3]|nr:Periplasmic serine proteases (ClpP class) [Olavius algarvensis associated proteobacterium Delta 3]CAB5120052.1 Periplasmic serine proteases (ClpP class) [Olavius algarvensis associated proteobacterium Delta 3]
MFSRRHPYLFFLLMMTLIVATASVMMSLLMLIGRGMADLEFGEKVGIVEIEGVIADSRDVIADIKRFREDASIKAIVLRVDSPGGIVGPSQEIYREIQKTIPEKPVITSMGSIAASGGYYVAAASNGIMASPGTITGSIGVIIGYTNFQEIIKKIGLLPVVIKSGDFKDIGSPTRKMTDEERQLLQEFVDQTHRQFVQAVADGRRMDSEQVAKLADGRIYSGEQAKQLGLIDRLGNLEDAIEWAGREGGIEGEISTVYSRPEKFSLMEFLAETPIASWLQQLLHPRIVGGYVHTP